MTLGKDVVEHVHASVSPWVNNECPPHTEVVRQETENTLRKAQQMGLKVFSEGRFCTCPSSPTSSCLSQVCLQRENLKGLAQTYWVFTKRRQPGTRPIELRWICPERMLLDKAVFFPAKK